MKNTNLFVHSYCHFICWVIFACGVALSSELSESAPASQIGLSYFEEKIPEAGTIRKTKITVGTHALSCQQPYGWQSEVDEAQSCVRFRSLKLSAALSITVLPNNAGSADSKNLRSKVGKEFAGSEIVEEFQAYTAGPGGIGFEIKQNVGDHLANRLLVAYLTSGRDLIELKLAAPEVTWSESRRVWSQFLNSFSVER
jgi:hypothetical protein